MHFGRALKQLAESKALKVPELATVLGMTRANVYRIFEQKHLNTELIVRASLALGSLPIYIFEKGLVEADESDSPVSEMDGSSSVSATGQIGDVVQVGTQQTMHVGHKAGTGETAPGVAAELALCRQENELLKQALAGKDELLRGKEEIISAKNDLIAALRGK